MGAFGIFFAVLTFIYIVYYAVMVSMDVMGDKGKGKESVEVIAVGNDFQDAYVEEPTFIKEDEDSTSSTSVEKGHPASLEEGQKLASAILSEDEGQLYAAVRAAEGEMAKVVAESDDEVTEEEYDNTRLVELVAEGERNAEGMSI